MPSYASAFLFSRDNAGNAGAYQGTLTAAELKELQDYLSAQPDAAAVQSMSAQAKNDLVARRTWALVYYLQSLVVR
jgi:hypothetical protein